jgi:hypothetical protein
LAVVAYATVVRIGFLSDDYAFLVGASKPGIDTGILLPQPPPFWSFYRPVGLLFTWELGWELWGFNPLPYHITGLLVHAAASLMLGLWLAEATRRPTLGWLAGALFAVFPLSTEAVGWLAAQWDALAALFAITSLYFFTLWWRRNGWHLYALALLSYCLGVFTKESLLAWLPVLAVAAWFVTPRFGAMAARRLGVALLPFCAALALNVGLRLIERGNIGGYRDISYDYASHGWEWFVDHFRLLVSPVNPAVLGDAAAQLTGVLVSVALLAGFILYGRDQWRLLLLSAVWIVLALLPALNLPPNPLDMEQNRFLYLPSAGYCVGVAALLHSALAQALRWRRPALALTGLLILMGIGVCWAHLRPWHTASVQVEALGQELNRLMPRGSKSSDTVWHLVNVPDSYKGAYLLRLGLGGLFYLSTGEGVQVKTATSLDTAPLARSDRDAFAIRFNYGENDMRWHVDGAVGITAAGSQFTSVEEGNGVSVWDFAACAPATLSSWQIEHARATCEPRHGLTLDPVGGDPYMVTADVQLDPQASGSSYVRVGAAVRYSPSPQPEPLLNQWFWETKEIGWSEKNSLSTPIRQDGATHIYWAMFPLQEPVTRIRFDPANADVESTIQWIKAEMVK